MFKAVHKTNITPSIAEGVADRWNWVVYFLLSSKFSACFHLFLTVALCKVWLVFKVCVALQTKEIDRSFLIYDNLFSNIMQKFVKQTCTFLILSVIGVVMVYFF